MAIDLTRVIPLCRLSIAVAAHRRDWLEEAVEACDAEPAIARADVTEAILQGIPYSGFPGAGEALALWRERHPEETTVARSGTRADGERIFADVYGDVSDRVRRELRRRHPQLEAWIIEFAYGSVMGREVLSLAEIEALGVASLVAQKRRSPLHSHLRGALRTGWDRTGLDELLEALRDRCDPDILSFARETIARETP